jgi:hypothetical protein
MPLLLTLILPSGLEEYSAVTQDKSSSKGAGYRSCSYHLPKYCQRNVFRKKEDSRCWTDRRTFVKLKFCLAETACSSQLPGRIIWPSVKKIGKNKFPQTKKVKKLMRDAIFPGCRLAAPTKLWCPQFPTILYTQLCSAGMLR